MLPDALKFDRYGSIEDTQFLIEHALSSREGRSVETILRFCQEKSTSLATSLSATLALLEYISMVQRDSQGRFIRLGEQATTSENVILGSIFSRLTADGILSDFIPPEAIEYDPVGNSICLRNNIIPLEYSGLKNFFISLGFFRSHSFSSNLLQINKELEPFFEDTLIPEIKEERFPTTRLKGLSLAALMRIQELNELHGREAEEFVLGYEQRRLGGSAAARVRIISNLQCDAGYDIASFNNSDTEQTDRFIEVKSYAGEISFFWSRNEVAVAQIETANYFLYLVNRERMLQPGYEPLIIQNPHEVVFLDKKAWSRDEMSWHFYK